jgi:hypothetical protein
LRRDNLRLAGRQPLSSLVGLPRMPVPMFNTAWLFVTSAAASVDEVASLARVLHVMQTAEGSFAQLITVGFHNWSATPAMSCIEQTSRASTSQCHEFIEAPHCAMFQDSTTDLTIHLRCCEFTGVPLKAVHYYHRAFNLSRPAHTCM